MTFPHHRSTPATGSARTDRFRRARAATAVAALGLALVSCGVDAGQDATPTGDASSATTTAAPTTAATTTTADEGGVGGVGGTNGDKGDKGEEPATTTTTERTGSGGTGDSTGQMTVDEISEEFQNAGLPKEQADCIAEIVHDADLTKDELDEFTQSQDGDTAAGKVLTDAMTQCFGLGE